MSFDIALSGIQAINQQLDAVSNNIANAGTYGFKSSRANFSSVYAGDQANGVAIGSTTQNIGLNGSAQSTGRSLDAAINGRGFFVSRDSQGTMAYSRVGIFAPNNEGFLVDSVGRKVQGYAVVKDSTDLGIMGDMKIPTGQIPAVATSKLEYVGNLSADWKAPAVAFDPAKPESYNMSKQSVLYDSLGAQHTLSQYFIQGGPGTVTVRYAFDGGAPLPAAPATSSTLSFDAKGQLPAPPAPPAPPPPLLTLSMSPVNGAAPITFTVNYAGTTQFAGEPVTSTNRTDGYASGVFVEAALAADGKLVAKYSNNQQQTIGTVAIATFADEGALDPVSDTSWNASSGSGAALYGVAGSGLAGKLNTGTLEGSNVDITAELVGLMTSQRNYQANSKVISTESAMMQALMQAL